ncbi:hypothetical protein ebA514 [Aromatoleum aromaticum EbN1]|uniref:Uncharacterized protein n=1 Tax=Aromatoleum aromaticum (strain DSM 19018 / LMG 30748 / EbN1) TaxID=76114 RepID=Q5P8H6_AROAE|nr:hypothetical protein [Aromatoleum aromaticum]CAI06383.1 hypothetical protein ebA514 [Aromatoleum aromaticum EbN1]
MSVILLAELLDRLSTDEAFIRESENDISVSGLATNAAKNIIEICNELGWSFDLYDSAGTEWRDNELLQDFGPYRLRLRKPSFGGDALVLLTNTGLAEWLRVGHTAVNWQVARLTQRIVTHARVLQSWGEVEPYQPSANTKSPRSLVREFGAERLAPEDVRPWLLREEVSSSFEDPASKVWMRASSLALLNSLADEIDPIDKKLKFKGPPKLSISVPAERASLADDIGVDHFNNLQRAASWVFENEREAELRHGLLANDIARSAGGNGDDFQCFISNISSSLDGAKVAYQVSLSDLGRDTLKMLADLRKAVTEETAKVTDATRQLVTAVAGALAISLGLIAARVSTAASYELIVAVMAVVAAYVGVVIYSGYGFIQLQRQLRRDWQPRLYRFLPRSEYESMVSKPANRAERTFFKVAWGGGVGVAVLTAIVIFGWWGRGAATVKTVEPSPEIPARAVPDATSDVGRSSAASGSAADDGNRKDVSSEPARPASVGGRELDVKPKDAVRPK